MFKAIEVLQYNDTHEFRKGDVIAYRKIGMDEEVVGKLLYFSAREFTIDISDKYASNVITVTTGDILTFYKKEDV